jgi:energy-coupling factor transporter transmembrane protein EcfT
MRTWNPACKFIGLLSVTLVLAWWHNPVINLVVFAVCLCLMFLSKVPLKGLFIGFLPILLFALGMFFTGYRFSASDAMPINADTMVFYNSRFWNGMTLASRVLAYAAVGYLFALTTDRIYMIRSFQRQFHLPQVFAYGLLAAWGIFPEMLQEYKRTKAAFRARGIQVFAISPALLKPLLVKSVRWSEQLAVAMESKGFSGQQPRTEYDPVHVRPLDLCGVAVCCIVFPIALVILQKYI